MGDMGDLFNEVKEVGKKQRAFNRESAVKILKEKNIQYSAFSESHFRIGRFDFWPGTGKYKHILHGYSGRGIFNLLNDLKLEL